MIDLHLCLVYGEVQRNIISQKMEVSRKLVPVIAERVEICSALAGEEGEVLYKMHLEQKCSE